MARASRGRRCARRGREGDVISAIYKKRYAAWLWINLAAHLGIPVEELGEELLDHLHRRTRS